MKTSTGFSSWLQLAVSLILPLKVNSDEEGRRRPLHLSVHHPPQLGFTAPLNSVQMQAAVFSLVVGEVWRLQAVCSRKLSTLGSSRELSAGVKPPRGWFYFKLTVPGAGSVFRGGVMWAAFRFSLKYRLIGQKCVFSVWQLENVKKLIIGFISLYSLTSCGNVYQKQAN